MEGVKFAVELYFGFFALLGAAAGLMVLVLFLPLMLADHQGHVRTTKKTSFANARICQTHRHFLFEEVKMKNLFGRTHTYTVYVKPEDISVRVDANNPTTALSVYPGVLAYFFIDNCATYYFDARRVEVSVPSEADIALWQSQIDGLSKTEKCRHEVIAEAA